MQPTKLTRDKKGFENLVADHLSRITVDFTEEATPISETFPDEQLMHIVVYKH
jgi:hypothetical protein